MVGTTESTVFGIRCARGVQSDQAVCNAALEAPLQVSGQHSGRQLGGARRGARQFVRQGSELATP